MLTKGTLIEFSTWLEPGPGPPMQSMEGPFVGLVESVQLENGKPVEVWVRCTDPDFVRTVRHFMWADGQDDDPRHYTLAVLGGDEDIDTIRPLDGEPFIRRLIVHKRFRDTGETIARYLPHNYRVKSEGEELVVVEGYDDSGWTLEGYVIPRLLSGNITSEIDGE